MFGHDNRILPRTGSWRLRAPAAGMTPTCWSWATSDCRWSSHGPRYQTGYTCHAKLMCHVSRYTSRVQVSLWAVFAAPFIISTDLRTIRQETRDHVTSVTRVTLTPATCEPGPSTRPCCSTPASSRSPRTRWGSPAGEWPGRERGAKIFLTLQDFGYRNGKVDFFTRPVHPTLGGRHSYVVAILNR